MNYALHQTPDYLVLCNGGSYFRMVRLRDRVAQSQSRPPSLRFANWRAAREYGLNNWQAAYATLSQGHNGTDQVWYTHNGPEFRDERDVREIIGGRSHNGWYTDGGYDAVAIGIVSRLSHGRFIAGYRWTSNNERVYFPGVFDDEADAARMADEHARAFAEIQFEHEAEESEED